MADLSTRTGLPDALRVLVKELPRSGWQRHPNFDGLTRFWMDRHLMFRDVLGRLLTGARMRIDAKNDPIGYARELHHFGGFFLNQLHGHHHIEDSHYFPQLQALEARLESGFALLDKDHHTLEAHIQGLGEKMNAYLADPGGTGALDRVLGLEASLTEFERFLDRHLEDEEDLIVPIILTYAPDIG